MIYTLPQTSTTGRRGRIWLDQLPDAAFAPTAETRRERPAGGPPPCWTSLAAELWIPTGPRALYGLAGLRFEPAEPGPCLIRIGHGDGARVDPYPDALGSGATARIGLEAEYAPALAEGLQAGLQDRAPAGELVCHWAVHCPIGSSPLLFRHLGRLLAQLLLFGTYDEVSLEALLRAQLG